MKKCNLLNINNKSDSKRQQTTAVDYKRLINGLVLTSVVTLHRQPIDRANSPTTRCDTTKQTNY
jgi:hypothetical protein